MGTSGQRFDHIGATPNPTIGEHINVCPDSSDHFRQCVDTGDSGIQLPAPMIGDNNARDATIKRPSAGPHLAQIQGKRQIYGKRGKGASMCTRKGL
jgi:hypothetical protein